MSKHKKLSNPFSTGGGGVHFEAHVQASFVALMLTGGHAPCLPCWPIKEIKLQGKIDGFDTDDLIVVVENANSKERRKLLGQVKHSIAITQGNALFGEVMQAAWNDFNNPQVFTRGKDIIALITGPLSATDAEVTWLLNHARVNHDAQSFFRNVETAKFSSNTKRQKLKTIRDHLRAANNGLDLTDEVFHKFLISFYLLGYDLGEEEGVILSLINSHISQFKPESSRFVWSRILEFTNSRNHHAGCITQNNLPDDLISVFVTKPVSEFPINLALSFADSTDWAHHPDATYLALAILIGSWQDKSQCDLEVLSQLFDISYDEWLKKAREILHYPDSPLSLRNGIWKVVNKAELWSLLGSRIFDQDLDTFRSLAVSVLKEPDPAFELPPEERYTASIHGKVLKCSQVLRKGITEGLAILGSQPKSCSNCSQGEAETTCLLVIRELLIDADWVLWGSLNAFLPALAEAAPGEFLDTVEKAMRLTPCPFDELFSQEGNGFTGGNYLTGLLWALEGLAWEEQYLVRVCVALGELASRDPGGQGGNRPSNSLTTILLPWLPQTLASVDKRRVAVETLLSEFPNIAWNLIIQLLPGENTTSSGSHKPSWRITIPVDVGDGVTHQEYWQQVAFYTTFAVNAAGHNIDRLSSLIDRFDNLPSPAFDQLVEVLTSPDIVELPEEQRLVLWDHLTTLTSKHRRFSEAKWALSDELISRIEKAAKLLAPTNPFNLYQHLFADRDFDLYEENDDWEEQGKKFDTLRKTAISEIFEQNGVKGVIRFAESVVSPEKVGQALGVITDEAIENTLLPHLIDTEINVHSALVGGFIWSRHTLYGWDWCDNIEKSGWTPGQIGQLLSFLPFIKDTWNRAAEWLNDNKGEYWSRARVNVYQAGDDIAVAIENLIDHGRPHAAIKCLNRMRQAKMSVDVNQCVHALLTALSSNEPSYSISGYHIVELIKFLHTEPFVSQEDLFNVEWAYLPLLTRHSGATPKLLESKLASEPEFFCEIIRLIYRSKKDGPPPKEPTEKSKMIAKNAWRLLHEWKTPPGTNKNGTFIPKNFEEWIQHVIILSSETGHLDVALTITGQVLIYAPSDTSGLWIHHVVAKALNNRDADKMRNGFSTGLYNSRGVHSFDPTGRAERKLAEQFRIKSESVENAGFHRLAATLKSLAESYDRDSERIVADHKEESE